MKKDIKQVLEQTKKSNDINSWILSLLSLTKTEIENILSEPDIPITAHIAGEFLLDNKLNSVQKMRIISDYIKDNIEEEVFGSGTVLKLEYINSKNVK